MSISFYRCFAGLEKAPGSDLCCVEKIVKSFLFSSQCLMYLEESEFGLMKMILFELFCAFLVVVVFFVDMFTLNSTHWKILQFLFDIISVF